MDVFFTSTCIEDKESRHQKLKKNQSVEEKERQEPRKPKQQKNPKNKQKTETKTKTEKNPRKLSLVVKATFSPHCFCPPCQRVSWKETMGSFCSVEHCSTGMDLN
jgi:hypothetical protein